MGLGLLRHVADAVSVDGVVEEEALLVVHADAPVARGRKLSVREMQHVAILAAERLPVGVDPRHGIEDLAREVAPDVAEADAGALQPIVEVRLVAAAAPGAARL